MRPRLANCISQCRTQSSWSKTLLLPSTKFGPKAPQGDLVDKLQSQTSNELYHWQTQHNANKTKFILHDGPPYANGDLHVGHALNKIIKDVINRFQLIYHQKLIQYKVGWDCHGLPIEIKVESLMSKDASSVEIRNKCKKWANEMIDKQKSQFQRFNIMTDFDKPYITMNHEYEINQLRIFHKLLENGLLSQQLKPVWWGCDTQTALAEAELEYNDSHRSIAVYVKFPVVSNHLYEQLKQSGVNIEENQLKCLIWTSTPWTIPANKAICVNKDMIYTLIRKDKEYLIIAKSLLSQVLALDENYKHVDVEIPGLELTKNQYINPSALDNEPRPILHGSHVVESAGTGLVHNAPSHGKEDYIVGRQNNLEINSIVDNSGRYIKSELSKGFKSLNGCKVIDPRTNMLVVNLLLESDQIYNINKKFIHSYPYDWRSKTPVIQRSTPQWFVNVEKIKPFARKALSDVKFVPDMGINRLSSFIENRSEWCISRQRCWGVPLPIVYKKSNDKPVTDLNVISHIISKINKYGTDEWFTNEENISRWVPFDGSEYYKGKDTMDVWFDSGTSWSTLKNSLQDCNGHLADVYLEGSDQHRGWFQSSLLNKIIYSGEDGKDFKAVAPFKTIITHGFIIDGKGQKMSKSKGNVFSPIEAIEGCKKPITPYLGSDGLRLWAASSNFKQDVNFNPDILKRTSELYKKYRITFRYLLGNLNNFKDPVPYEKLSDLDKYILHTLVDLQNVCIENYQNYNFARVVNSINLHLNSTLSAVYFDVSKDCLYTDSIDSLRRKSIQTVLNEILRTYIGLLSPIQPLLTQEVWNEYQTIVGLPTDSPFKVKWETFYKLSPHYSNPELALKINQFFNLRDKIFKQIEQLKKENYFKNKLELQIDIKCSPSSTIYTFLTDNISYLEDLFLVSKVNLTPHDHESIEIKHSTNHKCPRCWKFNSIKEDTLCDKCNTVIRS